MQRRFTAIFLALALILAVPAATAGQSLNHGKAKQSGGTAKSNTSGSLTLAALKQAAKDKGFTLSNSMSIDNTPGNPTPRGGFDIGVMNERGALSIVIGVLEFTSAKDAQAYDRFIKNQDGVVIHTHTYDRFYVEIQHEAYNKESDLMAAFSAVGWGR